MWGVTSGWWARWALPSSLLPDWGPGVGHSHRAPLALRAPLFGPVARPSPPFPHPRLRHISKPRTSSVIRAGKGHPSSGPPEEGGAQAGHLGCCAAGGRFPESPGTSPSGGERKRKGKLRRKEGTKNQEEAETRPQLVSVKHLGCQPPHPHKQFKSVDNDPGDPCPQRLPALLSQAHKRNLQVRAVRQGCSSPFSGRHKFYIN